jgi:NAD(P)-dependent dehydrogenase (short-subunit alcohol dehydrogenase family)
MIRYCQPDILINCVGQAAMNLAILSTTEQYLKVVHNNLVSTFLLCREAGKRMQARGFGRIINFGSCTCSMHIPGESLYTASKCGILGFSKVLAKELGPNVTVNSISPGPVATRLIQSVSTEKIVKILDQQIIKKMASFDDIRYVVDWLISENSSMITGQNIYLNGAG